MRTIRYLPLLTLPLLLAACGGAPTAPAVIAALSLPVDVTLGANVGEGAKSGALTVTNPTGTALSYNLSFPAGQPEWLTALSKTSGTLAANGSDTVTFSVTCPVQPTQVFTTDVLVQSATDAEVKAAAKVILNCTDAAAPTAALAASVTSVTTASTVTLTATASDNVAVSRVEVYEQGVTTPIATLTSPDAGGETYSTTVSFAATDNGARQYFVRAYDASGNAADTSAAPTVVTVQIPVSTDVPPPEVALPASLTSASGNLTITGSVADPAPSAGLASAVYTLTGGGVTVTDDLISLGLLASTGGAFTLDVPGLAEGAYTFGLAVTDAAGLTTTKSAPVTVDFTAPMGTVTKLTSAPNVITTAHTDVTAHGTVTDNLTGVTSATYTLTGSTNVALQGGNLTLGVDGSFTQILANLPADSYVLAITGTDGFGNTRTTTTRLTVNANGPDLSLNATPDSGSGNVTVTGMALQAVTNDNVSYVLARNGSVVKQDVATVTADGLFSVPFSDLTEGTYTITVTGANGSGVTTVSDVFVVDSTPPVIGTIGKTVVTKGKSQNRQATLTFDVTDTIGVSSVQYRVNSGGWTLAAPTSGSVTNASYRVTVNGKSSYTVTVRATDVAGNVTTSDPISIP